MILPDLRSVHAALPPTAVQSAAAVTAAAAPGVQICGAAPHKHPLGLDALAVVSARYTRAGPSHNLAATCLPQDGSYDLSAPPPFGLADIREAIPKQCWEKNAWRSMAYLALDVGIVAGLAIGAYSLNAW